MKNSIKTTKPIALIGMMGVGKSFLGKALAAQLSKTFIDSDEIIEKIYHKAIPSIFAEDGESGFREKEYATITKIIDENESPVIATGGGCVTYKDSFDTLKSKTITIWLNAPPEECYERIKGDQNRPLLQTESPLETLQSLYNERKSLYAQADITVTVDAQDPEKTIQAITKALYEPRK